MVDNAKALAKKATAELVRLQPSEVRERLGLDERELAVLGAIARSEPVRNAALALQAIKIKIGATLSPPPQTLDMRHSTIPLLNPYYQANAAGLLALEAGAVPAGRGPVINVLVRDGVEKQR